MSETIDNRTANIGLLLPSVSNSLVVDVTRIIDSFTIIDAEINKKLNMSDMPVLAEVAISGDYNDLINKPNLSVIDCGEIQE